MKMRKTAIALAAGLAVAGTLWTGGAAGAQTTAPARVLGPSCSVLGCSSVVNDSNTVATALRNWCLSTGSTGTLTTTRPACGTQSTYLLGSKGSHTPWDQDWDVLQVDAGWCYYVKFTLPGQPDNYTRYDRRGKSAGWVKVEDFSDAHVLGQSQTSCP
ncbi:hypothetical protein [Streptosporangium sp. NPDC049644]|uniref:hypothetical protein n=1 Tax=Streptosporangium sp. NPDC049644 TaxID=3155507 RepID=UPI00342A4E8E